MKRNRKNTSNNRKGRTNNSSDFVSFKLHGIQLVDKSNLHVVESIAKNYNSAKRCAIKRFQSIGLNGLMKGQSPIERNPLKNFKDFEMVDGHPCFYQEPTGMSKDMWYNVRKDAYLKKRLAGLNRASKLWQLDKDLGSPISGTEKAIKNWMKSNDYDIDSILLHNAILDGLKTYKAFDKKKSKYKTSKNSPAFGDFESRSRNKITKEEFQLTRNGSFTIIGQQSSMGNPKFRFNENEDKMTFTFKRKGIEFDLSGNRFSKSGYAKFCNLVDLMNDGKLPVTITLSMTGGNKFEVILTYSQKKYVSLTNETSIKRNNRVSSIYCTDEVLCHQIVDLNTKKVIHFKKYDIGELFGTKRNKHSFESLKWDGKFKELSKLNKRIRNTTFT